MPTPPWRDTPRDLRRTWPGVCARACALGRPEVGVRAANREGGRGEGDVSVSDTFSDMF